MKATSLVLCTLMLCVTTGPEAAAQQASAQQAFARLKTLTGNWKGQAVMGAQPGMTAQVRVSMRVTSGGVASAR